MTVRKVLLIAFVVIIQSCKEGTIKPAIKTIETIKAITASYTQMQATPELTVTSDFDGDGKSDTLTQIIQSGVSHKKMDSMPNPYFNNWDSLVLYGNKWDTHICIIAGKNQIDTLDVGQGMGLYCLINLGRLVSKQDVIAFVPIYYDFSNLNKCRMYALKEKHWKYLGGFSINETAFTSSADTISVFHDIPGYLKREKLTWVFRDNEWDFIDYHGNPSQFQNLKKHVLSQMKLNRY